MLFFLSLEEKEGVGYFLLIVDILGFFQKFPFSDKIKVKTEINLKLLISIYYLFNLFDCIL